jgi:hypothetical protein
MPTAGDASSTPRPRHVRSSTNYSPATREAFLARHDPPHQPRPGSDKRSLSNGGLGLQLSSDQLARWTQVAAMPK